MGRVLDIIITTRGTGNTTWILKSAIMQPNCVIVSKNRSQSFLLEKNYLEIFSEQKWCKKLYWKLFINKSPKFMSIEQNFKGLKLPIIFDNGCFC